MDVGSVINQGLMGMQRSQVSMTDLARQIAQAGTVQRGGNVTGDNATARSQSPDLAESLVNLRAQSQVFDSSARVVKSADETLGTLLDVRA